MATGLALYIHVPFCLSKCYYCDFFSQPYCANTINQYLGALEQEARLYLTSWPYAQEVTSIYIGGGTPTVLTAEQLVNLLELVSLFPRAGEAEWTVEANPDTLSREKLFILREYGVNRLSLGVQSFDDQLLRFLGRTHTAAAAQSAWEQARRLGFANMNLDLIFGIPGQSEDLWRQTIARALSLQPDHVSAYGLTIEPGTEFARRGLAAADEELELAQYRTAQRLLERAGLIQYEISSFARSGYTCQHNLVYWRNEPYLGLGPAAVSYLNKERRLNVNDIASYVRLLKTGQPPIGDREQATEELAQAETVILALRLKEGLSRQRFRDRFGWDVTDIYPSEINHLLAYGLVTLDKESLRLTAAGWLLANQAAAAFLPDNPLY